jgi:hypothetical protein
MSAMPNRVARRRAAAAHKKLVLSGKERWKLIAIVIAVLAVIAAALVAIAISG